MNASDAVGLIGALQHAGVPAEYVALVPELPGDYNGNGTVDAADYTVWRDHVGVDINLPNEILSLGLVDQADYDVWRAHFGQTIGSGAEATVNAGVAEPASTMLLLLGMLVASPIDHIDCINESADRIGLFGRSCIRIGGTSGAMLAMRTQHGYNTTSITSTDQT